MEPNDDDLEKDSSTPIDVTMLEARPRFTCPLCKQINYSPMDVQHQYCRFCHMFV